jgi:uncharacterized membrane protein
MTRNQVVLLLIAVAVVAFVAASAGAQSAAPSQSNTTAPSYYVPSNNSRLTEQERRLRDLELQQCRDRRAIEDEKARAQGNPFGSAIMCHSFDPYR